ncbi:hypothetical protein BKE30_13830 [Alkanindiges hydrocarboniclasticus]|uniref:Uncharacterized protein n=1 Tax=Alkanindiges hydrocarboniclasticus TaxID=1907941 RepID=A0A1S8CRD0_9GAMM|nr:hypothetical protein [Alkanindiges hydrocarboniclasticus]ONG37749.1 hypothetical protein BKE30_13830 [Alkanindiges hydrocarboniclasticus]
MSSEKPPDLDSHNIQLEFKYRFKIKGYKETLGQGTIIVSHQSTDNDVKQAVNDYVLKKIIEFLRGKPIDINKDFSIDSSVKIINAFKVGERITKPGEPASQARQIACNQYGLVLIKVAWLLLMFLAVV